MENKLWSDIQAQGENLVKVVEHLYTVERPRIDAAAAFLRNDRPIMLIGVASAEYLCMPAVAYLSSKGRFAATLCAADAFYTALPALKNANVIINSRSGETIEVVKLGQALVDHQIPFVTITNEPDSTLARMATHVVWANTRKDELVSINVVTGMMTTTLALAAAVTGELDALLPQFDQLAAAMAGVVERATQLAEALKALMQGVRPVYMLYRGASQGAAYCGRLAMEEIGRSPSIAMEAAQFRQGPNEVIDARFGAVVFVPDGKQGELNLALADDILRLGGRALVVGSTNRQPASSAEMVFPIEDLPDFLRPVLEVVSVQVMAYGLAAAQGYEPGTVRYISKVITSEAGIPNQA